MGNDRQFENLRGAVNGSAGGKERKRGLGSKEEEERIVGMHA